MAARADELYRQDFYAWTRAQADALRRLAAERWNGPLDLENLAEEIEDLGSEQRWGVESRIERLLEHALKLEHSPDPQPRRQWRITLKDARRQILRRPTKRLRNEVEPILDDLYAHACEAAAEALADHGEIETARALPVICPYGLDQILDRDWLPVNRHGLVDEPL